jgi:hypothetical protein
MNNLDLVIESVNLRKPISYEYNKPGKTPGKRYGNVHVVYIFTSKKDIQTTKVDIVQTSGVTDSPTPFPTFKMFNIEDLGNIEIMHDEPQFKIFNEQYRPDSDRYVKPLAKV